MDPCEEPPAWPSQEAGPSRVQEQQHGDLMPAPPTAPGWRDSPQLCPAEGWEEEAGVTMSLAPPSGDSPPEDSPRVKGNGACRPSPRTLRPRAGQIWVGWTLVISAPPTGR